MTTRIATSLPRMFAARRMLHGVAAACLVTVSVGGPGVASADIVSQTPLQVGIPVPGNLVLTPSVEWPTVNSVANLGDYDATRTYAGYFDSAKCYQYSYNATEALRHFYPVSFTATRQCTTAAAPWSGNFLNWAATQTIDAFRAAMTGGFRVRDTPTETWLEKARHDGQGGTGIYPNRRLPGGGSNLAMVEGATPFSNNWVRMRIQGLGNEMRIRVVNDGVDTGVVPFNPSAPAGDPARACQANGCTLSMRVAVCVPGLLESNCELYALGAKPEGTLQEYAGRMRYSVFGYLNDHAMLRDGAALRARQKFIGPVIPGLVSAADTDNPNKEWDPVTGVLFDNPDPADAAATSAAVGQTISYSGVINYLNRFGQMTGKNHKSFDPVSEMYYAAIRYLKNLGNVSAYTSLSGSASVRYELADGFPVITAWNDPVQYWCQQNTILGIGDIYTHRDKNLPGSSCGVDEPAMPGAVSGDSSVNVVSATNQVGQMEGIGNIGSTCSFTGRNNSAFMAGLAWDSRVRDIRPDIEGGRTTVSTYWVDVLEALSLEGMARNQYALAAKYGGARVPDDFDPVAWGNTPLPESWWHTNGETLTPFGPRGSGQASFRRPDNFFTAGEAPEMVQSLRRAFANIAAEMTGSGASLAANSTKLETGTTTFQAQFFSGVWRGELNAFSVDPDTGELLSPALWRASNNIPAWASRQIYVHNPEGGSAAERYRLFTWSNLGPSQRTALDSENLVNYLRGERANEAPDGPFRVRSGLLGDIVHSQPIFVGRPNARLHAGAAFTGAASYASFVAAQSSRRGMVYVGANDGMLHGFDAATGAEVYAFIPNRVIHNELRSLASQDYEHRYFVDGELTVADVYFTGGSPGWRTVLVGTLGRGGPGLFALDVTDPNNVQFLWEKSAAEIPDLGRNIGKPVIAQVANGDWRVILGNGPDNVGEQAQLVMVGVQNGTVTTVNTGAAGDNGLSAVFTWDTTADGFADTAFAGDLQGNLWRFRNLAGGTTVMKLFEAVDGTGTPQPITAAPLVGRNPDTGARWVFFGTGRYLGPLDPADMQVQTWYGITDSETSMVLRSELVGRSILAEGQINGFGARVIEEGTADQLIGRKGWYIDLQSPVGGIEGERMVVPNQFQGRVLVGTTRIADASDICRPTGRGFVMAINPFTGARLDRTFFDFTRDSLFNDDDKLLVDGELVIVSGIGFASSPNNPIFIENVMQVSLDDGRTQTVETQGTGIDARRMSWRELTGN